MSLRLVTGVTLFLLLTVGVFSFEESHISTYSPGLKEGDVVPGIGTVEFATEIPLANWNTNVLEIAPYSPPVVTRTETAIEMKPNQAQPWNTFGFIEGTIINVSQGSADAEGDVYGFRVTYESPTAFAGLAPEFRVRTNTTDFARYAIAGDGPNELLQGGQHVATAVFDRATLSGPATFRPFMDFLSAYGEAATVDPNFTIRILKTEFFTASASGGSGRDVEAAWIEINDQDLDLYARPGIGRAEQSLIEAGVDTYCFDGPYVVAIDRRRLWGFDARTDYEKIVIEDDDDSHRVLEVTVNGDWVMYYEVNLDDNRFQIYLFNLATRERKRVFSSRDNEVAALGSADDGQSFTYVVESSGGEEFDLYYVDATQPTVEPVKQVDNDLWSLKDRTSSRIP